MEEAHHDTIRTELRQAAVAAVAGLPTALESIGKVLRAHDPIGIMACFACYGLVTAVSSDGAVSSKPLPDIYQHHAELLQALVLTIPFGEWGHLPVVPDVMQSLFETLPRLFEGFAMGRLLAADAVVDKQEKTVC